MTQVRRARRFVLPVGWLLASFFGLAMAVDGSAYAAGSSSLFAGPLVVPGGELVGEVRQLEEAEEAQRNSPEGVAEREASQTRYQGLSSEEAVQVAQAVFPGELDGAAGGLRLPEGQEVSEYVSAYAARIDVGEGERGVVESATPIAVSGAAGSWVPLDLSLAEDGQAFVPARPATGVRIQRDVAAAELSNSGVSLSAVGADAGVLEGSGGSLAGAAVFYANTQSDTDTSAKPTTAGFALDTILRSARSPSQLYYHVGLPAGVAMMQPDGAGRVEIVDDGSSIASIAMPRAWDATGAPVPLALSVVANTLTISISSPDDYEYPILVDPEITEDKELLASTSRWSSEADSERFHFYEEPGYLEDFGNSSTFTLGEVGWFGYVTQGTSQIYEVKPESESWSIAGTGELTNSLAIVNTHGESEEKVSKPDSYSRTSTHGEAICPHATCSMTSGSASNAFKYQQTIATSSGKADFKAYLFTASVSIAQKSGPSASFDTADSGIDGAPNALYGAKWINPKVTNPVVGVDASDPGLGIYKAVVTAPAENPYSSDPSPERGCEGVQCFECWAPASACPYHNTREGEEEKELFEPLVFHVETETVGKELVPWLPEGEVPLEVAVENATGEKAIAKATVLIDYLAPWHLKVSGLPASDEIGESVYHVKAEATDPAGYGPKSSGIASLELQVDGKRIGGPKGACQPGECTASAEWSINGAEFGAGEHQLTEIATDNAGNVAIETTDFVVHHARPVSVGPGEVDPQTGEFGLAAEDVAMNTAGATLTVSREYQSHHLTAGAEGPLGPQWVLDVGGEEGITKQPNGNATLTAEDGGQSTFVRGSKGEFAAPSGDKSLVLIEVRNAKEETQEYVLEDPANGAKTRYGAPSGSSGVLWKPVKEEGPLASETTKFTYQTAEPEAEKKIVEPKQELAPEPSGVTCTSELQAGCRALEFVYAETTTASGEGQSEWGDYKGRLKEVLFSAYSTSEKRIVKTAVAHYAYDKVGRLRSEWDPRISPALKTSYGYDAEGRVVALSEPGEETWAFMYGTSTAANDGLRLLKARQAPVGTSLWKGEVIKASGSVLISGSPLVGTRLTVSNGEWSGSPIAYGYQWEACNSTGGECTAIEGATNANYKPREADQDHELRATVTAINGDGTATETTPTTALVWRDPPPVYSTQLGTKGKGNGEFEGPAGVATDSKGDVWVVDAPDNRVEEFNEKAEYVRQFGSEGTTNGKFKSPAGIAVDTKGNVWVVDTGNNRVQKFNEKGEFLLAFGAAGSGNGQLSSPRGIAVDSKGNLWVVDSGNYRVEEFNEKGEYLQKFGSFGLEAGKFAAPRGIVVDSKGNIWVSDELTSRVQEFDETFHLLRAYGTAGAEFEHLYAPCGLGVDSKNDVWIADSSHNLIAEVNSSGQLLTRFGSEGTTNGKFKAPKWITVDSKGSIWVSDTGNDRVQKLLPGTSSEGEHVAPQTGWTMEYAVPLSGAGAPYAMAAASVSEWAQSDVPVEATATFPPAKPIEWPATSYTGATVEYLDANGRTVNVANPYGGITTNEYNADGDMIRTLSADDRATALKEAKPAEAAKLLDTQNTYGEGAGGPGARLLEALGPQHKVKLAVGKENKVDEEALARNYVHYYYDEGAPGGETYNLVTKAVDSAEAAGKEEFDKRTTLMSFSGQSNLGWKLRRPTSVTREGEGIKLSTSTEYSPTTGEVIETRMPAAIGKDAAIPLSYAAKFSASSSDDAVDAHGDVWVTDYSNNRVQEFSAKGAFIEAIGFGVTNGEAKFQICTSECRAGIAGSGNGQFSGPYGIAISGGTIYVTDYKNARVEEFNEKGEYAAKFGSKGTGAGQFESPLWVTTDAGGDIWVSDSAQNRLQKFSATGTFIEAIGFGVSNGEGKFEICTSSCRAGISGSGNGQFSHAEGMTASEGDIYAVDWDRVEKFNEKGEYISQFGSKGAGAGQLEGPSGIVATPGGTLYVTDSDNNRVEQFTSTGSYLTQFGTKGSGNGQFTGTDGIATNTAGGMYVVDNGDKRVEEWIPAVSGNESAHDTKTIYYQKEKNTSYPTCGEHPEWANLPCEITPAAQPAVGGLPELPVTTIAAYNMWDEPEVTKETFGATSRTTTSAYDAAERPISSEIKATSGATLPKATYEYNSTTGALWKEDATIGGKAKTITSTYNAWGELENYIDADENVASYKYDAYGRPVEMNDGKGIQSYEYSSETGAFIKLSDTAAGTFTAGYDTEGDLTEETYPNGMTANYSYNQAGEPVDLEYVKTSHCTEKCTWFSDAISPSVHGETISEASTLANTTYLYDAAGRITQAQETPTGEGCTTRVYNYDEDANRTSITSRTPGSEGKCASEGGTTTWHTYDTADRLADPGVEYSPLGDITSLPAEDAGGHTLTSTFYTDNRTDTQTQNGQSIGYELDPSRRTREMALTGTATGDIILHYAAADDSPAWSNELSGKWTRYIQGIDGMLSAIQNETETPTLELHDLKGDIIGAAPDNAGETTKLSWSAATTEYGTPTGSPQKYSWQGGLELPTEFPTGIMAMGARTYVPQLGRFLQPDPVEGGSANSYTYTYGDPVNENDPDGELHHGGFPAYMVSAAEHEGQEVAAEVVAREAALAAAREQDEAVEAQWAAQQAEDLAGEIFPGFWQKQEMEEEQAPRGGGSAVARAASECRGQGVVKKYQCDYGDGGKGKRRSKKCVQAHKKDAFLASSCEGGEVQEDEPEPGDVNPEIKYTPLPSQDPTFESPAEPVPVMP